MEQVHICACVLNEAVSFLLWIRAFLPVVEKCKTQYKTGKYCDGNVPEIFFV